MKKIRNGVLQTDVVIVGAGLHGLATAIKAKELMPDKEIVVLEKASEVGGHNASGLIFDAECLQYLHPEGDLWMRKPQQELHKFYQENKKRKWEDLVKYKISLNFLAYMLDNEVRADELFWLSKNMCHQLPMFFVPAMRHKGHYAVSITRLVQWLAQEAKKVGVKIFTNHSVESLIFDEKNQETTVIGVRTIDRGRTVDCGMKPNFRAGEAIHAKVVVIAEGAQTSPCSLMGQLMKKLRQDGLYSQYEPTVPQIYSVGVKKVFEKPPADPIDTNWVMHTLGYPLGNPVLPSSVFGGGFVYRTGNFIHVGLVGALDARYYNFDYEAALEQYLKHWRIASLIKGCTEYDAGSHVIPEAGYYALPKLFAVNGCILGGDLFVDMRRIMGAHNAIKYGVAGARALKNAFRYNDFSQTMLHMSCNYYLNKYGVLPDMYKARNFRQFWTLPWQQRLNPFRDRKQPIMVKLDYTHITNGKIRQLSPNKTNIAALSRVDHSENQPSHISIKKNHPVITCEKCIAKYDNKPPCVQTCPAGVYAVASDKKSIIISAANCQHCECPAAARCPYQLIEWKIPEQGGPDHKEC